MNILEEVKHHFTESIILISLLQADQLVSDNSTSQLIKLSKSQAVSQVGVSTHVSFVLLKSSVGMQGFQIVSLGKTFSS